MAEDDAREKILPLWEHVNELARLLRAWIYSFIIATVAFMVLPGDLSFLEDPLSFYKPLISVVLLGIKASLLPPSLPINVQLISGTFTAPVELYVVSSVILGFTVSVPVLAYRLYRFIDPALKPSERESIYPFTTAFSLLFVAGLLFGFFVLLPFVIYGTLLFFPYTGALPFVDIEDFYGLVFFTMLMTGFAFTLPVFLVLLVKFHILETRTITGRRLWIWVGVYILTAIVTPDGGPIADVALFVPIILLLEGSLFVARRYEKGRPLAERKKGMEGEQCRFCGGPMGPGGVFCGLCGKSRL